MTLTKQYSKLTEVISTQTNNLYGFLRDASPGNPEDPFQISSVFVTREWANPGIPDMSVRLIDGDDEVVHSLEWMWNKDSSLAWHVHDVEETIECVSGAYLLHYKDKTIRMGKGSIVSIPAGVVHAGYVIEDTHVITRYTPPLCLKRAHEFAEAGKVAS